MLDRDQIQAWQDRNADNFAAADRAIERAAKGTVDMRLIHAQEELPIVRALRAKQQMIDYLCGVVAHYVEDEQRRFENSVGMFDRNGNRTD